MSAFKGRPALSGELRRFVAEVEWGAHPDGANLDLLERCRDLHARLRLLATDGEERRVAAFLAWADGELAIREAALAPAGFEARFAAARLFGDDDFSFWSPHG